MALGASRTPATTTAQQSAQLSTARLKATSNMAAVWFMTARPPHRSGFVAPRPHRHGVTPCATAKPSSMYTHAMSESVASPPGAASRRSAPLCASAAYEGSNLETRTFALSNVPRRRRCEAALEEAFLALPAETL